jgi:hypothetical protein
MLYDIAYEAHKIPWLRLYEESITTLSQPGAFHGVRSVHELDDSDLPPYSSGAPSSPAMNLLVDPGNPPNCGTHPRTKAWALARPCGHAVCPACFGETSQKGMRCGVLGCGLEVQRFTGFSTPVSKVNVGAGSQGRWWEVEKALEGIAVDDKEHEGKVLTNILDEDPISLLHA